jgi:hypothetical protein
MEPNSTFTQWSLKKMSNLTFSLASFATHLAVMEVAVIKELETGLEKVAAKVEKTAKAEIGHYQEAVGPFPKWTDLKDSTKDDRERRGFTRDDPGLRRGDMRDSITHQVGGFEAEIGSNDDHLVWFELGTSKQDPRPVLGPAVQHNHDAIHNVLGGAAVRGLLNGQSIPGHPEYDYEV